MLNPNTDLLANNFRDSEIRLSKSKRIVTKTFAKSMNEFGNFLRKEKNKASSTTGYEVGSLDKKRNKIQNAI